ncbi:MAG: (deoxy)nucleoside triphosphate pyrophosphohydrolase [Cryomorphaceae bacterium]
MKTIQVVAAVLFWEGKVLCVQRTEHEKEYVSLKWEFPGGKVEVGESREDALVREIREELSVDIEVSEFLMTVEHTYPDFHLTMHVFKCILDQGEITLNEHVALKWLSIDELDQLDWAAADIPVVEFLMQA